MFTGLITEDYTKLLIDTDQTLAFKKYGITPELNKKYFSIFRTDKTPGCRFEYKNKILYFVDNSGYNNKLFFNAIDLIMELEKVNFKKACSIYRKIIASQPVQVQNNFFKEKKRSIIQISEIPFTKNHFYSKYNLPHDYLNKLPDVHNFNGFKLNGQVNLITGIAFSFDGRYKLHFPNRIKNKFITNFTKYDILLKNKINWDAPIILISKSRKESALFDYHLNLQSVVQYNEVTPLYDELLKELIIYKNSGGRVIVLMDNDDTGNKMSNYYKEKFQFEAVVPIKNDFADDYLIDNFKKLKNEIYNRK